MRSETAPNLVSATKYAEAGSNKRSFWIASRRGTDRGQWWVSVNLNLIRCFYEFGVNKLAIIIEK